MAQDYYQVLSLDRSAEAALVDRAYRLLARRCHPDTGESPDAIRFQIITEAWRVLSDPVERRRYDRLFADPRPAAAASTASGGSGGDRDVRQQLPLRFEQAAIGGNVTLTRITPAGPRQVTVNVPAAVEDGQQLRLRGLGLPADRNLPAGDLVLTVTIAEHPRFRRRGLDLHADLAVPLSVAVLGGLVTVASLDGEAAIDVPAGSSTGDRIRLRARGLRTDDGRRGDLYAVVHVMLPAGVAAADSPLAAALREPASTDRVAAERIARQAAHAERAEAERRRLIDLRHVQLDQWQQQLEDRRRSIADAAGHHAADLTARQGELAELAARLHQADRDLVRRQAELDQLAAQLDARLAESRQTGLPVVVQIADAAASGEREREREDEARSVRAAARRRLLHAEATSQQAGHRLRLAELREHELRQWQDRLEAQHAIIDGAHAQFAQRHAELADRHAEQTRRHAALTARRAELAAIAERLTQMRHALSDRAAELAARETELARLSEGVARGDEPPNSVGVELLQLRALGDSQVSVRRGIGSPLSRIRRRGHPARRLPSTASNRVATLRRLRLRRRR